MARAQFTWGAFGLGADDGAQLSERNWRGANGSGAEDAGRVYPIEDSFRSKVQDVWGLKGKKDG
jgi:hypothetical protein